MLFALFGLATGPCTGALFTARNDHAPERLRAQIFTLGAGVKTTAAAAGAALAGALTYLPAPNQLGLAGTYPTAAGLLGTLLLPRAGARTDQPYGAVLNSASAAAADCR